jgi:catalase
VAEPDHHSSSLTPIIIMPLSEDPKVVALSEQLIAQFKALFGTPPGFRPAHAKGALFTGEFTPSAEASSISIAPHFSGSPSPVTVRFSSSTGIPVIPDTDPNANPRGFGLRFHLPLVDGKRQHTDLIAHSTPGFPTQTGDDFLKFLQAVAASGPDAGHPSPIESFLGSHPSALAFVQTPKPFPTSLATEQFFGVTALKFIDASGKVSYGRYRVIPDAGLSHLTEEAIKDKSGSYLYDEIQERIAKGSVTFTVTLQIANEGDVVNNSTIFWPEDRKIVELGKVVLTSAVTDSVKDAAEQKSIIYDPIPRIKGIEPSDDPLIELRAAIYLISGRERRAAA